MHTCAYICIEIHVYTHKHTNTCIFWYTRSIYSCNTRKQPRHSCHKYLHTCTKKICISITANMCAYQHMHANAEYMPMQRIARRKHSECQLPQGMLTREAQSACLAQDAHEYLIRLCKRIRQVGIDFACTCDARCTAQVVPMWPQVLSPIRLFHTCM